MDKAKQDLITFLDLFDKAREDNRQIDYSNGVYRVNLNTFNALAQAANQARRSLDEPLVDAYALGYELGFNEGLESGHQSATHFTKPVDSDIPPPSPIYAEPEGLNILWQKIKRRIGWK